MYRLATGSIFSLSSTIQSSTAQARAERRTAHRSNNGRVARKGYKSQMDSCGVYRRLVGDARASAKPAQKEQDVCNLG